MTTALDQALTYINSFKNYELTTPDAIPDGAWDLSRIETLLARLGSPHRAYPVIHIAGSKGKGSTAAFCTQALVETGLRTGLYISPHLIDFRERIQINREQISTEALVALTEDIKPHAALVPDLTWFELLTALAFWHFEREGVDAAIIEVGLGGRLDATNIVTPLVSVITRIGLDHTELLGDTLAEIAGEKAAIIKPEVPVVTGPQEDESLAVIQEVANRQGSPLTQVTRDSEKRDNTQIWTFQPTHDDGYGLLLQHTGEEWSFKLGPSGLFQAENAAIAVATLHHGRKGGLPIIDAHIARGLETTRWRGRFEVLSSEPLLIVDSAHNPQSAGVLANELRWLAEDPTWTLVFGCMADKDVDGILAALLPSANRVILTQAAHPRAMSVDRLRGRVDSQRPKANTVITSGPTVAEALNMALSGASIQDRICVTGSLAVAGEAIVSWERLSQLAGA
jgi:dihydrofolate synthase/folylpolyglutamate synthase